MMSDNEQIEGVIDAEGNTRPMRDGDGLMECLGPEGDTKKIWDPENKAEVEDAERTFDFLTEKGYRAFHVEGKDGKKGGQMDKFDPDCGRMIMIPQLQGG